MTEFENLNSAYYKTDNCLIYQGNALSVLRGFPDGFIDCVVTSPPYWALRDYKLEPQVWDEDKNCLHKWNTDNKIKQNFCSLCGAWKGSLGLENTFDLYLKHLWQIFDEIKRILKPTGTCWVNLGDSYSGSGCGTNDYHTESSKSINGIGKNRELYKTGGITQRTKEVPAKSLCLIPERFSIGMVDRGWILRNTIIWHKRNCMPASCKDRFTVDFEKIFFFTKSRKYWFEQQFEKYTHPLDRWGGCYTDGNVPSSKYVERNIDPAQLTQRARNFRPNELGRNMRAMWQVNTKPFKSAHFAVFPPELPERCIKAGCPEFVCVKCGKTREKVYRETGNLIGMGGYGSKTAEHIKVSPTSSLLTKKVKEKIEIGYTFCNCDDKFKGGIVLDPFMGAGTTGLVAKKLGRKFIGIELNQSYCNMSIKRIKNTEGVLPLLSADVP